MNHRCNNQRGFSLVELLVAVAIIGILTSFISTKVSNFKRKAVHARAKVYARNILIAYNARTKPVIDASNTISMIGSLCAWYTNGVQKGSSFDVSLCLPGIVKDEEISFRIENVGGSLRMHVCPKYGFRGVSSFASRKGWALYSDPGVKPLSFGGSVTITEATKNSLVEIDDCWP